MPFRISFSLDAEGLFFLQKSRKTVRRPQPGSFAVFSVIMAVYNVPRYRLRYSVGEMRVIALNASVKFP